LPAGLSFFDSLYTFGVSAGDIDNDGDQDIFITTWGYASAPFQMKLPNILLRNNSNGTFTDISVQAGITDSSNSTSASFGDYNRDGFLDIYVANYVDSMKFLYDSLGEIIGYDPAGTNNYLYMNNGNNTFSEIAEYKGVSSFGCALTAVFSDFDNDRDPDMIVANDFGAWTGNGNALIENGYPTDTFVDVAQASGMYAEIYGMGIAVGDYDNDGNLDYYITNIGKNVLYRNNGDGTFSDVTDSAKVGNEWVFVDSLRSTGWGANFFDFDLDGDLDLFVSNGWVNALIPPTAQLDSNKLFRNLGNGQFEDVSSDMGFDSIFSHRGSAMIDYDNDGDLDIVSVANNYKWPLSSVDTPRVRLYRNDYSDGGSWLAVGLVGICSNRDGIGSRLIAKAGNRTFVREIRGGSSHASRSTLVAHFGLDNITILDTLWVYWPSGHRQFFLDINVNALLVLTEDSVLCSGTDSYDTLCLGDTIIIGGYTVVTSGVYPELLLIDSSSGYMRNRIIYFNDSNAMFIDTSICVGNDVFGVSIQQDTLFTLFVNNPFGCDTVLQVDAVVLDTFINFIGLELTSGDYFNGTQVLTDTMFEQAFLTQDGCDSLVRTMITIVNGVKWNGTPSEDYYIYPNPFSNQIYVVAPPNIEDFFLVLKTISGKEIVTTSTKHGAVVLKIPEVAAGQYVIEIRDKKGYFCRYTLMKQ
jgi:hypothetical protein